MVRCQSVAVRMVMALQLKKYEIAGAKSCALLCVSCRREFIPSPRLGKRQKTCGDKACEQLQRAGYRRQYRKTNLEAEAGYESKRREARGAEFWPKYREDHPVSTARNRAQSRLRKKLKKAGLQRQLDIVQLVDPIGNLDLVVGFATSHRSLLEQCVCKPTG